MKLFHLPDLGEGLPDAVVREWHVAAGDTVATDAILATVETAKALVDVPSPWAGTVEKLFADTGQAVTVGEPLVGFVDHAAAGADEPASSSPADAATVVGRIATAEGRLAAETAIHPPARHQATPAARALARRLGIDLASIATRHRQITSAEVEAHIATGVTPPSSAPASSPAGSPAESSTDNGTLARRAMAEAMANARDQVMPMTLQDAVDVSAWWGRGDPTIRLLRAVVSAALAVPEVNAHFVDGRLIPAHGVHIGLAVDSPRGLYVPVLRDLAACTDAELRQQIESFKQQAATTGLRREDLLGATLLVSNFGSLGGRYATPVVVPPCVAIVGVGRAYQAVVPGNDGPTTARLLPLSVSADHRAITGAELARFLTAIKEALLAV